MGELTHSIHSRTGFEEGEDLVLRLKEKDEAAFAEAFQLYKDLIFNLSFSMLADKSEAMDITQEVFLTLYRKIHRFRGECSLKTWLYRIALNQISNRNRWWRRRFRHRTVSLSLNGASDEKRTLDLISDRPQPDRQLLSLEVRKALREGMDQLPFEQRAAVTLRDMHGLTYQEIAGVLGVHVGTVKSRIARGRNRLRELLKPYWGRGAV
jgi:RNA polymerase sigma-70 factor (ECF subfamily)